MTTTAELLHEVATLTAIQTATKNRLDAARATLTATLTAEAARKGVAGTTERLTDGTTVRLDPVGDWAPTIADREELAAHLAEHHPRAAVGVITVPADLLAECSDAVVRSLTARYGDDDSIGDPEFITTARLDVVDPEAAAYLANVALTVDPLDPTATSASEDRTHAEHIDPETGEAVTVPGIAAARRAPRLVVTLSKTARTHAQETTR